MAVAYRDLKPEDRRFVVSAWSASFKLSHSAGMIWTDDWPAVMHAQIGRVLDRGDVRTLVAYETKDPAFVYGFLAADPEARLVYYVYVKEPYRRAGYARGLFAAVGVDPAAPFSYVCKTGIVSKLAEKIPMARWDPLAARFPKRRSAA